MIVADTASVSTGNRIVAAKERIFNITQFLQLPAPHVGLGTSCYDENEFYLWTNSPNVVIFSVPDFDKQL